MASITKTELVKIMSEVVDNRLKKLLPKLIEIESKKIKSQLKDEIRQSLQSNTIEDSIEAILSEDELHPRKKQIAIPQSNKIYTKDEKLNKILQQTAIDMRNNPTSVEGITNAVDERYKQILMETYGEEDMRTFNFGTDDMSGITGRASMIPPMNSKNNPLLQRAGQEVLKQEIAQQSGNPELANSMIKDYRALLKASKKISDDKSGRI